MFNTLQADSTHNPILITVIDLLTQHGAELRVLHIPGQDNVVADCLSRWENATVCMYAPGLTIYPFIPPLIDAGGAFIMIPLSASSRQPKCDVWMLEHLKYK